MIFLVFFCCFLGLIIGNIKLFRIRMGFAGILLVSLFVGYLLSLIQSSIAYISFEQFGLLSSLGTALFISSIGLASGNGFQWKNLRRLGKALLSGIVASVIGVLCVFIIHIYIPSIKADMLLGILSGSMTSTPAMSSSQELCANSPSVAIGYGLTYCTGLLSISLFTQHHAFKLKLYPDSREPSAAVALQSQKCSYLLLSLTIIMGIITDKLLHLGQTLSMLLIGIFIGRICRHMGKELPNFVELKQLGLILFLVSSGIPAGLRLSDGIIPAYFLIGILISVSVVFFSYFFTKYVLRFSQKDTLTVLCGGMTSTPAIGILEAQNCSIDFSLFSASYIAALITLLSSVKILYSILI